MRYLRAGFLLAALCSASAHAQSLGRVPGSESGVTLFGGFRSGGDLSETTTGQDLHADTTPSFAVALDLAFEERKQLQLFYSRQKTQLTPATVPAPVVVDKIPLKIEYLHLGGTAFFDELMGEGGYASAGVGATRLTPNTPGFGPETKPSISITFGYLVPIVPGLALRFELRGYATWVDSKGGLFCKSGGGCALSIKGDALYQGDGLIGLTARF